MYMKTIPGIPLKTGSPDVFDKSGVPDVIGETEFPDLIFFPGDLPDFPKGLATVMISPKENLGYNIYF